MTTQLSDWITIGGYCAIRVYKGTAPELAINRVAFIEMAPQVRIASKFEGKLDAVTNWIYGPKGSTLYGKDPNSRAWCDKQLIELGYKLENK